MIEIQDQDLGFDDFFDKVDLIGKSEVEVGYTHASGGTSGDLSLLELAVIQEVGTETIPARPFMRLSADNNENEILDMGVNLGDKYLDDKIDDQTLYEIWGDDFRNIMRNGVITRELDLEANAQVTIDRKGSDTPLIDTKSMINRADVMVNKK